MADAPRRFWPPEAAEWFDNPWPGMLLRIVTRDANGQVIEEKFKRVPVERDLQEALDWCKSAYS